MKPVTLWSRVYEKDDKREVEHNHLEYGHCENDTPTPVTKDQEKAWKNHEWVKEFKHLDDDYVVVD